MFCKPVQDRRVSPAMVSKGSIYAAAQQDGVPASRVLNGNGAADGSDPDAFDISVSSLVVVVACVVVVVVVPPQDTVL